MSTEPPSQVLRTVMPSAVCDWSPDLFHSSGSLPLTVLIINTWTPFLATTARSIWASLTWSLAHRRFRISSTEILNPRLGLIRSIHSSLNTETECTGGFTIDFAPRSLRANGGKPRCFETSPGADWHIIWIMVKTDLDLSRHENSIWYHSSRRKSLYDHNKTGRA